MAHFAKLDENNVVLEVHVVSNNVINNLPFPKSEPLGVAFLVMWSGGYPYWKQTSYNMNFRKHFAGIGFTYDESHDAFIPPKPAENSVLNLETFLWDIILYPSDGKQYNWDEETKSWVQVNV